MKKLIFVLFVLFSVIFASEATTNLNLYNDFGEKMYFNTNTKIIQIISIESEGESIGVEGGVPIVCPGEITGEGSVSGKWAITYFEGYLSSHINAEWTPYTTVNKNQQIYWQYASDREKNELCFSDWQGVIDPENPVCKDEYQEVSAKLITQSIDSRKFEGDAITQIKGKANLFCDGAYEVVLYKDGKTVETYSSQLKYVADNNYYASYDAQEEGNYEFKSTIKDVVCYGAIKTTASQSSGSGIEYLAFYDKGTKISPMSTSQKVIVRNLLASAQVESVENYLTGEKPPLEYELNEVVPLKITIRNTGDLLIDITDISVVSPEFEMVFEPIDIQTNKFLGQGQSIIEAGETGAFWINFRYTGEETEEPQTLQLSFSYESTEPDCGGTNPAGLDIKFNVPLIPRVPEGEAECIVVPESVTMDAETTEGFAVYCYYTDYTGETTALPPSQCKNIAYWSMSGEIAGNTDLSGTPPSTPFGAYIPVDYYLNDIWVTPHEEGSGTLTATINGDYPMECSAELNVNPGEDEGEDWQMCVISPDFYQVLPGQNIGADINCYNSTGAKVECVGTVWEVEGGEIITSSNEEITLKVGENATQVGISADVSEPPVECALASPLEVVPPAENETGGLCVLETESSLLSPGQTATVNIKCYKTDENGDTIETECDGVVWDVLGADIEYQTDNQVKVKALEDELSVEVSASVEDPLADCSLAESITIAEECSCNIDTVMFPYGYNTARFDVDCYLGGEKTECEDLGSWEWSYTPSDKITETFSNSTRLEIETEGSIYSGISGKTSYKIIMNEDESCSCSTKFQIPPLACLDFL
ncbi:hypothetical protein JXB01_04300 [Candidatus Micrarchaeota archaeon]|nr:hypothetical protein [Candidatus Micrarchaeota archaeon]